MMRQMAPKKYTNKRKTTEVASTTSSAAAAAGGDGDGDGDGGEAPKSRGRPKGDRGSPVLERLIKEQGEAAPDKWWAKFVDCKRIIKLPPPYTNSAPCWDFNPKEKAVGATLATSGYGELAVFGREKSKLKMHVLAHFLHTGEHPVPSGPKQDISHLCHRKSCFNPAHLVREEVKLNESRDYCLAVATLDGEYVDVCPHTPKCLRPGNEVRKIDFKASSVGDAKALVDDVTERATDKAEYHRLHKIEAKATTKKSKTNTAAAAAAATATAATATAATATAATATAAAAGGDDNDGDSE